MRALRLISLAILIPAVVSLAETHDVKLFGEMRWRMIGPYRGGRTRAICGVPQQPNVFYVGMVNGGVWKTNDYGRTWLPIFDDQPSGSIGTIAVAPSDPNIVYVGSGEGLQRPDLATGDGLYKSTDAGKMWTHLGLRDAQQIPQIAVDPKNPNRLFIAVLGHPYGPNAERGIFRSTDGGKTLEKVLYKDENTGGSDVAIDPLNPNIVYADLWESRQGPWENGSWSGTGGGLFKSTDGGTTWKPLKIADVDAAIQVNIAIAPSNPKRVYTSVASSRGTGIYRSEDAGETWTHITNDNRPASRIGGGDLSNPVVDPKNPDIVYTASTVTWKSIDGGKTWEGLRGAPGGDDYQKIWINPDNPQTIGIVSDQGAIITVNGGDSWSTWYNQPTAAMYHVTADNAWPYRLCSGQQDSGSACIASRGNDGQITVREWHPIGVEEYGYAAPDPLDPDIVYGGKVTKYDRRTGQVQNVSPKPGAGRGGGGDYRALRTAPVVFSPLDPRLLFFAANTLWSTRDGGQSWQQISPDLARSTFQVPANVGKYRDQPTAAPSRRGVIYALGPSPRDVNVIWAGTDDGLIHLTRDGGKNWSDVTPPQMGPFYKVSSLDASHFDTGTAYAAINTLRLDDMRPHLYRTRDYGKTWTEINSGIPDGAASDVLREDPVRKGLLFAGTETQVYVSFDDGDHWQSLRLNMPATSIRDLIIKDDDVAVGTHGRGFWILDNISVLRQLTPEVSKAPAFLFKPQTAVRVRWDMNPDTPLPPDEPAGANPPDGAMIDYVLSPSTSGPVTLEILDTAGSLIRKYSSEDPIEPIDPMLNVPKYWVRPPSGLSKAPGMHRFLWDMHYTHLSGGGGRGAQLPIAAVFKNTVPVPDSLWVLPGTYTVKLTANGKSYTESITVAMDPRVKTAPAGIKEQFTLSKQCYDEFLTAQQALAKIRALRAELQQAKDHASAGPVADSIAAIEAKLTAIAGAGGGGGGRGGPGGGGGGGPETIATVSTTLNTLMRLIQGADTAPTSQVAAAVAEQRKALAAMMDKWTAIQKTDLPNLNAQLKQANLQGVSVP